MGCFSKLTDSDAEIRVYVACLACYNEGRLHGVWIDATDDADDIDATRAALQENCGHTDNDWAIHDYEGFHGVRLSESESFANVSAIANALSEHGEAFGAWLANGNDADSVDAFTDAYRGCFSSLEAYAEQLVDDCGYLQGVPDVVARYFDFEAFARDMELGGDVWTHDGNDGVHVFDNH